MISIRAGAAAAVLVVCVAAGNGLVFAGSHDSAFWRAIVRDRYTPPPGADVTGLVAELTDMLASSDPEARDDIAYSTLANWIYQRKIVDVATLRTTTARLIANLSAGIGEPPSDAIFRRSFSALTLSVIVARDNADPFLAAAEWRAVADAAIAYLAAERDLRGYDETRGWMHSAAHTADLLKFLGRSRHLDAAGQRRLLDAIGAKLATASNVFVFGEDERFARALLSLTARTDFDAAGFAEWLTRAKPALSPRPTLAELRAIQNWKNTLAKLEVLLATEPQPSDDAAAARAALRGALKQLF